MYRYCVSVPRISTAYQHRVSAPRISSAGRSRQFLGYGCSKLTHTGPEMIQYQYSALDWKSSRKTSEHNLMYIFTWMSHFVTRIFFFLLDSIFFLINTGYSLIDFDVIFLKQSSEITKLLNFWSILEKKLRSNPKFSICSPKNRFFQMKKYSFNLKWGIFCEIWM